MKIFILIFSLVAFAQDYQTNELAMHQVPPWAKRTQVQDVTDRIQQKLEWRIRRVDVFWHSTAAAFAKAQNLGPQAIAVTLIKNGVATVHFGPTVTEKNYQQVLAHELVHVIVSQKYKDAIPKWLEEGLANHLAKKEIVNYRWLSQQPFPKDVSELSHPLKGNPDRITYSYMASQALAQMLEKRCDLENLLRLSVQRKLEDYIKRTCQISDLNTAFRDWVKQQSK